MTVFKFCRARDNNIIYIRVCVEKTCQYASKNELFQFFKKS